MPFPVSEDYLRSRTNEIQSVSPFISIGYGIDTTALDDVTDWIFDGLPMSNTEQISNANYLLDNTLATYEDDGIPTAVDYEILAPPLAPAPSPPEVGVWSAEISDADGNIDWSIDIRLSHVHTSAFTVYSGGIVRIVDAVITYYKNNVQVRSEALHSDNSDIIQDRNKTTYDRIVLKVTKIDQPFHHVRVAEIEFGASITLSKTRLNDTISLRSECDPLDLNIPLSQLEYSIINVDGEYDVDNPSKKIDLYKIGAPVYYSLTMDVYHPDTGAVTKATVPMGRFYITSRDADEERLSITAQDVRSILRNTVRPITLSTTKSVGATLQEVFEAMDIGYVIEPDLYSLMPDENMTMPNKTDLLHQLLWIQQYFDVFTVPDRDSYIHAVKGMPVSEGSPITANLLVKYPKPSTARGYNYISINYGGAEHFDIDLRPDPDSALMPLNITNPLINTQAKAQMVADRIESRFFTQIYEAEAIGDPAYDVWDMIAIEGRWTHDDPLTYRTVGLEYVFDGGLTMYVKGVR